MPLQHAGNRIELGPAEVRGADEIAADDAHPNLCPQPGHFRLQRNTIAEKEIEAATHTAAGVELRLEASHAGSEIGNHAAAPHSLHIEKNVHALLTSGGGG